MKYRKHLFTSFLFTLLLFSLTVCGTFLTCPLTVQAKSTTLPLVALSSYQSTMEIGDEAYLVAITSNGAIPSFKSSKSSVASVNTYGLITAKSAGTVRITAKIKNAEASCKITVKKTTVSLNKKNVSMQRGETFKLQPKVSTGHAVTYKTNKKSVATVSETGVITAQKPGEAVITVTADKTSVTCKVKVKTPTIKLSKRTLTMYRGNVVTLKAVVSSKYRPTWTSSKKSVATVSSSGTVKALKHGTTIITASLDGASKTCEVTVKSPEIRLNKTDLILMVGSSFYLKADVASEQTPTFTSSKSSVASVSSDGKITALKKGTATITVSEDGTKERCTVHVIEQ